VLIEPAGPASRSPPMAWRDAMPAVHAAVDQLVAEGAVRLRWKGQPLPARAGPYRIERPAQGGVKPVC
jgi:hypothetical protein